RDGLAVDLEDQVTLADARLRSRRALAHRGDDRALLTLRSAEPLGQLRRERLQAQAQLGLGRAALVVLRHLALLAGELRGGGRELHALAVTPHTEVDLLTDVLGEHRALHRLRAVDRLAVDRDDHVARLEARLVGRLARLDLR